ncbi:MAG: AAA family ATPase, partial [bacterium]|nr:AAA family ATPase [bacterium]
DCQTLLEIQQVVRMLPVAEHIVDYAVNLVRATRPEGSSVMAVRDYVRWGAGPRASQYLIVAAKTRAALMGKGTPDENDVNEVSGPVLRHRILRNFKAEADGISVDEIIRELIQAKYVR